MNFDDQNSKTLLGITIKATKMLQHMGDQWDKTVELYNNVASAVENIIISEGEIYEGGLDIIEEYVTISNRRR
jgi:major membrane immunogen (membrane-anchored lipoprotein)